MTSPTRRNLLTASAAAVVSAPSVLRAQEGPIVWRMVTSWAKGLPGPGVSADRLAQRINAMSGGRLRVDVGSSVARLLIVPNLAQFQERYPDIQIDLGVSDRTVDLIGDNVDFGDSRGIVRSKCDPRTMRPAPCSQQHASDTVQ
jgi:hypothetical protein